MFRTYESSCEDDWPSCDKAKNIVCERGGHCDPLSGCVMMDLDEKFRQLVLDGHNFYRNEVAVGNETRYGNGEAANMMALSYDIELEFTAICYVNQCGKGSDSCRRTKNHTAGQNIYFDYEKDDDKYFSVTNWYNHISKTNEDIINAFATGWHEPFTQIVWAETTRVGCARSKKGNLYYFICNYGNSGNIPGSPVYVKGTKCSKCPPGISCNVEYKGLCGEIDKADVAKLSIVFSKASKVCHLVRFHSIMLIVSFASLNTFGVLLL
ncbi:hypothetical protein JTB14_009486 [Gonioctena quinquepunctata]|nr:hypothetical protein JTB14_009486 [Gonioctena quinquepunctata]